MIFCVLCLSIFVLCIIDFRKKMVFCKKWMLVKLFIGKVIFDNFKFVKEDILEKLNDGGRFIFNELISLIIIIY